jgi:hypothetical protein
MSGIKNISISPVIARNAFVDRGFDTGEIIFIPPISLPYLPRHPHETFFEDGRDKGGIREG